MSELQIRRGTEDSSKIIFLISQRKRMLLSLIRTVPGRFAPNPFPPLDVSPPGRFAPGHFAPGRFAPTGRFAPWTFRPQISRRGGRGALHVEIHVHEEWDYTLLWQH